MGSPSDEFFLFIIPSGSFACQSNKVQRMCEMKGLVDKDRTGVIIREGG
jgi:hypothetical protein